MVRGGTVRSGLLPFSALFALGALLGLGAASAAAASPAASPMASPVASPAASTVPAKCQVKVSPLAAQAGSAFVFKGSGFSPTTVALHKDTEEATVHDVAVAS